MVTENGSGPHENGRHLRGVPKMGEASDTSAVPGGASLNLDSTPGIPVSSRKLTPDMIAARERAKSGYDGAVRAATRAWLTGNERRAESWNNYKEDMKDGLNGARGATAVLAVVTLVGGAMVYGMESLKNDHPSTPSKTDTTSLVIPEAAKEAGAKPCKTEKHEIGFICNTPDGKVYVNADEEPKGSGTVYASGDNTPDKGQPHLRGQGDQPMQPGDSMRMYLVEKRPDGHRIDREDIYITRGPNTPDGKAHLDVSSAPVNPGLDLDQDVKDAN